MTRAAANSIASGIPSRRRQIRTMMSALSRVGVKAGSAARARSMKSCVASECTRVSRGLVPVASGSDNEGTRHTVSPDTAKCFTARGDNPHGGRPAEQRLNEFGAGGDQVLAGVQHQQELAIAQPVEQGVASRSLWLPLGYRERSRLFAPPDRATRAAPDRPAKRHRRIRSEVTRQPYRQPCLSNAPGSRQRQQSRGREHLAQLEEFLSGVPRSLSAQRAGCDDACPHTAQARLFAGEGSDVSHDFDRRDQAIALARHGLKQLRRLARVALTPAGS